MGVIIHYKDQQFSYRMSMQIETWDNDKLLDLMDAVRKHYSLEGTFCFYEKVGDEQLIIDDIDDMMDMFDDDDEDDALPQIYVKDAEQIERELWSLNSYVLIYSRSKQKWFEGQIIKIYGSLHDEWLVVKYNVKSTKEIQRNSTDIKPIPSDNIKSLRVGKQCLILSEYSNIWYQGEVLSVLNDDEGEWLAIKYTENDLEKIADIQRYSKQLRVFNQNNYDELIAKKNKKEPDTLNARLNALHRTKNENRDNEVKDLMIIFSNILKSPFNTKYQSLNIAKLKRKFKSNPICIELLYDAAFKKSKNGKKLTFSINDMKVLKKTDKAVKEQFPEIAQMILEEEKAAVEKVRNAEEYNVNEDFAPLFHGNFDSGRIVVMNTGNWDSLRI